MRRRLYQLALKLYQIAVFVLMMRVFYYDPIRGGNGIAAELVIAGMAAYYATAPVLGLIIAYRRFRAWRIRRSMDRFSPLR